MPAIPHIASLSEVAARSETSEHFSYALRDFLDGFYSDPTPDRLSEEPESMRKNLQDEGYADAYLAAVAEHLAGQYRFPVPAWCWQPERILREPHFAFKTPEGQIFLLVESPTAFRVRNLFVSAEALTRV